jgi:hypothetical protein
MMHKVCVEVGMIRDYENLCMNSCDARHSFDDFGVLMSLSGFLVRAIKRIFMNF